MMNGLSVGDGFKFGCGFFIAGFITWLAIVITMTLFMVLFSATISSIFGDLDLFGALLPLLGLV